MGSFLTRFLVTDALTKQRINKGIYDLNSELFQQMDAYKTLHLPPQMTYLLRRQKSVYIASFIQAESLTEAV